jgi:hypothetical protein
MQHPQRPITIRRTGSSPLPSGSFGRVFLALLESNSISCVCPDDNYDGLTCNWSCFSNSTIEPVPSRRPRSRVFVSELIPLMKNLDLLAPTPSGRWLALNWRAITVCGVSLAWPINEVLPSPDQIHPCPSVVCQCPASVTLPSSHFVALACRRNAATRDEHGK